MFIKLQNNVVSLGILDDSSLAATTAQDGSRYVFFQEHSGSLRQINYSQTTLSWTSGTSKVIPGTTDARRNAPLAAVIIPSSNDEVKHLVPNTVRYLIMAIGIPILFLRTTADRTGYFVPESGFLTLSYGLEVLEDSKLLHIQDRCLLL